MAGATGGLILLLASVVAIPDWTTDGSGSSFGAAVAFADVFALAALLLLFAVALRARRVSGR